LKNLLMAENPRVVRRQHIMSWWGIIRVVLWQSKEVTRVYLEYCG
jgi:hypothetical protein